MNDSLNRFDKDYIRYILDEIYTIPTCNPEYGWDYDDLEDVINNGLNVNISIPSYEQWIKQKGRDQKINEILNEKN